MLLYSPWVYQHVGVHVNEVNMENLGQISLVQSHNMHIYKLSDIQF